MIDPSTFVNCVVLGVIGWITYKVYIYPYHISPLRKIPGPPSKNLFFGNFKSFITEESGEPYVRWVKQYGSFVKFHGFLNRPSLLISDAKIIQEIVSNQVYNFPKPESMGELKRIIGEGLFLAEGDMHKRQRKMMNPAFTHINVKGMVPSFIRVAFTLKGLIEDKVNKGESKIIISTYLSKTTLDVIGLVGFNHEFNTLTSPSKLAEAYDSLLNTKPSFLTFTIRMLSNYVPIRKFPIAMNKKFNNACKVISQESEKLMEEKYRNDKLDGNDLLSLLIKINNDLPKEEKMTKEELRDQIMTFLLAGHETTSNSISWALYFLAKHPREQDLLREELVKAFPDKSTFNPTFDEINSLEYLNCIIKETLRLVPAVIGVTRYNTEDRVLGGHFIPKDTQIDIPITALHRLPSIWGPTADEFDPQRWLNPSLIKNVTNYNYLPFHTGVRSCIGSKVATSEFKIVLSMLVRNFVFQTGPIAMKKKVGFLSKPDPYLELIVSNVEI